MRDQSRTAGVAGLFDRPEDLLRAARGVCAAGWKKWDCHTPYPVHGLDQAMGLAPSPIPLICIGAGFGGVALAVLMQGWMSAVDYPLRTGGKPYFSGPAFVPITFELFVLFASLAAFGALIFFCRLGRWRSPLHDGGVMAEVTTTRFAVVLAAEDERFDPQGAAALLESLGCRDIRELPAVDEEDPEVKP